MLLQDLNFSRYLYRDANHYNVEVIITIFWLKYCHFILYAWFQWIWHCYAWYKYISIITQLELLDHCYISLTEVGISLCITLPPGNKIWKMWDLYLAQSHCHPSGFWGKLPQSPARNVYNFHEQLLLENVFEEQVGWVCCWVGLHKHVFIR